MGRLVEAFLAEEAVSKQFSIPKAALVRSGQESVVFVQAENGFKVQPVTVVSEQSEQVVVSGDFNGNEKIAVSGTAAIKSAWIGASK